MKPNAGHKAMHEAGFSGVITKAGPCAHPYTVWVNGETLFFTDDRKTAVAIYTQAYDEWRAIIDAENED